MADFSIIPSPPCGETDDPPGSPPYLIICIGDEGKFNIQGSRQAVEEFLVACAESGMQIQMDYLSWCG